MTSLIRSMVKVNGSSLTSKDFRSETKIRYYSAALNNPFVSTSFILVDEGKYCLFFFLLAVLFSCFFFFLPFFSSFLFLLSLTLFFFCFPFSLSCLFLQTGWTTTSWKFSDILMQIVSTRAAVSAFVTPKTICGSEKYDINSKDIIALLKCGSHVF